MHVYQLVEVACINLESTVTLHSVTLSVLADDVLMDSWMAPPARLGLPYALMDRDFVSVAYMPRR